MQLGLTANFKCQVLQWDGATVHMKEPSYLPGKFDINKRKMRKVVMHPAELAFTQEDTERMVKIIDSTYIKSDLKQVADNGTQMSAKEKTLLLSLIEDFKDLFDGTLG